MIEFLRVDVYGQIQNHGDPYYCAYSWEIEHLAYVRSWW